MKRMRKIRKSVTRLLRCLYAVFAIMSIRISVYADEMVTVDGNLSEWSAVDALESEDRGVSVWKLAKSEDGSMLYFSFSGIASTQWDSSYQWKYLQVTYENGTSFGCQIANIQDYWIVPGALAASCNGASGNNPGLYAVECALPMPQSGYTIQFAGISVDEKDIPVFVPAEKIEPVYNGIAIDGNFDDWDAVTKTEADCPPEAGHAHDCLDSVACVFDGDMVYLYLKNGASGSAAQAGVSSNGRYSITTDLGRQITFDLRADNGGSINGVEGATAAYFGKEWEIAIPASALPKYQQSISFGLYQAEPFVSGIMNLQGSTEVVGEFEGIVYDGLYGDWDFYPHTLIQYATSGTQNNNPDGEGALYVDGSILYGHVISSMDAHLAEMGGEFAKAISICFNGDRSYNGDKTWNLYPRLVMVGEDGAINWNPVTDGLPTGTYEFYIADIRGEYNAQSVMDLQEYEQFFGKLTVTVNDTNDEVEFYVDLEKVAAFLSHYSDTVIEAGDFKLIEAQFGRIGQDWLVIAGTSTGAFMGVALCMSVVGFGMLKRRRDKQVVKE